MSNLLTISTMFIGIISLVIILAIITIFVIVNIKKGGKLSVISLIEFLIAFLLAIFLAKPMVALFDKLFSFSMVFFHIFMLDFGQIESFNTPVTLSNYDIVVENFQNSSVGMSGNLKNFLIKIFEKTNPSADSTTTLGAIASRSLSYLLSLFIIAFILFVVFYVLIKILTNFINKRYQFKKANKDQKVLGGILGFLKGTFVSIIVLVIFSTIPFFGTAVDYLGSGFQTTKIFDTPYQFIVSTEQDLYVNAIDFKSINKLSYQNSDDVLSAHYQNEVNTTTRFRVDIIITNSTISIQAENLTTYALSAEISDYYIFVNNTLYLYKSNKLLTTLGYNTKNHTVYYKAILDNVKVNYTLKIV